MNKLLFVTNNKNKLQEIKEILDDKFEIISLKDIGFEGEIPETSNTIEGNALQKARYIYNRYHINCFADDTGLMVNALDGAPGVYSARYAGENATYQDNVNLLLQNLKNKTNRDAYFITVIALILDGKEYLFEGKVEGSIIEQPKGVNGFGYDPVFLPNGYNKTFAEMTAEEKHAISHRGRAVQKLVEFLKGK